MKTLSLLCVACIAVGMQAQTYMVNDFESGLNGANAAWGGTAELIDRVGKGMAGIDKFSKCIPSASSSSGTQSIRTVDSQGNVVDTGMARFRKYKFGGGGVGAEVQSTEIRTGNGVRTKNHIRFNFGFFDIQVGK